MCESASCKHNSAPVPVALATQDSWSALGVAMQGVVQRFIWLSLILIAVINLPVYAQEQTVTEVEVRSDRLTTNLNSAVSRLDGNVVLSHNNMTLTSGFAEAFPATDNLPARYELGDNLVLKQQIDGFDMTATSGEAVYTPALERLLLQQGVSFHHEKTDETFNIEAQSLTLIQKQQRLQTLNATGSPAVFSQQWADRRVVIRAEAIDWQADTNTALLKQASLDDGSTSFSATEIEYNTKTGAVTASGRGEDRPRYRFNTDSESTDSEPPPTPDTQVEESTEDDA